MAIKAKGQITLSSVIDVKATYRYYLLQSSTLTKPSKPTLYPPSSTWGDTEPTYTSGSTNSLYFVDCTVFSDDTFAYSEVSLSSSYEAAKAAYNKALSAEDTANQTKEDLDNLEIGGKNLLIGTGNAKGWSQYDSFDKDTREFIRTNSTVNENFIGCENQFDLVAGQEYTLSFQAKQIGDMKGTDIYILPTTWSTTDIAYQKNIRDLTDQYKKYICTFIPSSTATSLIGCRLRFDNNGSATSGVEVSLYVKDIKLEKGNKATDWTPAPEDVDDDIYDTEKRILEATTEADTELVKDTEQILLKAFENYTLKNNGLRIVSVDNYYNATTTDVDVNMSTDGYITGVPALSSSKPYLLAYEVATYDDGSTVTSDPHLIATYSSSAISTITEHYAASPAVSEEELTEVVWSSTVPEVTSTNICLWHYETITFTNGTTVDSEKRIIGRYQKSFNELVELVESQLQVLKDSINMNFTTTSERTEYVNGELQTFMEKFYNYIKFSGDTAITIGSGDSAITLEIDNDTGIIFKKNGVEFGSWDGVDFHTGNIVVDVEKRAQFGNFAFVPRSDGSLMFLKVGG